MIGYNEQAERDNIAELMHWMSRVRELFEYKEKDICEVYKSRFPSATEENGWKKKAVVWWYANLCGLLLEKKYSGKYAVNFYVSKSQLRRMHTVLADCPWNLEFPKELPEKVQGLLVDCGSENNPKDTKEEKARKKARSLLDSYLNGLDDEKKEHIKACLIMQYQITPLLDRINWLMKLADEIQKGKKVDELYKTIQELKNQKDKDAKKLTFDVFGNDYAPLDRVADVHGRVLSNESAVIVPGSWTKYDPEAILLMLMVYKNWKRITQSAEGSKDESSKEISKGYSPANDFYAIPNGHSFLGVYGGETKTSALFFSNASKSILKIRSKPLIFRSYQDKMLVKIGNENFFSKLNDKSSADDSPSGVAEAGSVQTAEEWIQSMKSFDEALEWVRGDWKNEMMGKDAQIISDGKLQIEDNGGTSSYWALCRYQVKASSEEKQMKKKNETKKVIFSDLAAAVRPFFVKSEENGDMEEDGNIEVFKELIRDYFKEDHNAINKISMLHEPFPVEDGKPFKEIVMRYVLAFLYKGEGTQEIGLDEESNKQETGKEKQYYVLGEDFFEKFKKEIEDDGGKCFHEFVQNAKKENMLYVRTQKYKKGFLLIVKVLPLMANVDEELKNWIVKLCCGDTEKLNGEYEEAFKDLVLCGFRRCSMLQCDPPQMTDFAEGKIFSGEVDPRASKKYSPNRLEDWAFSLVCGYIFAGDQTKSIKLSSGKSSQEASTQDSEVETEVLYAAENLIKAAASNGVSARVDTVYDEDSDSFMSSSEKKARIAAKKAAKQEKNKGKRK